MEEQGIYMPPKEFTHRVKLACGLAAALSLVLVSAACGSSSPSSSGGSSGTASSAQAKRVAAADKIVAQLSQRPTSTGVTTPITKPIPKNISYEVIGCGATACDSTNDIIHKAVSALGWKFIEVQSDGSSAGTDNAWEQIIRTKPSAVEFGGTPAAQVQTYINQAAAEGVYVQGSSIPIGGPHVSFLAADATETGAQGEGMAAWVVADAAKQGIKNPGVLYASVPDFPILSSIGTTFTATYNRLCPGCKILDEPIGFANIAQAPAVIVSALRSNPNIQYVVYSAGNLFDAVTPAIKAAGLKVRIMSGTPSTTTYADLKVGTVAAVIPFAEWELAYELVDEAARHFAGAPIVPSGPLPQWIMTSSTLASTSQAGSIDGIFPVVSNVASDYEALWKPGLK
jgi:ribose transport system substrate-binding protein